MNDMVELRCKYCGAPLDRKDIESDSPYVTCRSCGTSQQRVDAKAYMEQMMGQIQSWISKSIPGGFSLSQQENVDPVARHNIYINNIKPTLDLEMSEYRFAMNSVISSPLVVLPFCKGEPVRARHTSTQAFEFNARLKSVEALAVEDVSRAALLDAENLATAYALMVNNSKLLTDTVPGRFALMSNNFLEAADAVDRCDGYDSLALRLRALSEVCTASDMILNGDGMGCVAKMEEALPKLEHAKSEIMKNPRMAVMLRAVNLEISQANTLKSTAEMSLNGQGNDALGTLELINKIKDVRYPDYGDWGRLFKNYDRGKEIQAMADGVIASRADGGLDICPGSGSYLVPFWDVDLKYSFTTGSLFSKKVVEVTEDLLIPAVFTVSPMALENPRYGLTDIFSAAPETSILDRIKGNEDSISGGEGIGRLADSATPGNPGQRKVVVPLSTNTEAAKLAVEYLAQCSRSHSKLKLSKPFVKKIIYVPCEHDGSGFRLPDGFGRLAPAMMSRLGTEELIIL